MKKNSRMLRTATATLVVVLVAIGFVTDVGIGTVSAPGLFDISILCPLGALGSMLASKLAIPRAIVSLVIAVVLIVLFARAFCAWICPVPLLEKLRGLVAKPSRGQADSADVVQAAPESEGADCASCAKKRGESIDSRHFALAGALVSTFAFGFPVFCLVCPIGLTFAIVLLVINLFAHGDVTWALIVLPAILACEVIFFRKWCHKLCPLSALMSMIGKANKTFVPAVDETKCLESSAGTSCGACGRACGESIDIRHPELSQAALNECTKCRACVDACPASAIKMPLLKK